MTDPFQAIADSFAETATVSELPTRRPFMIIVHSHRPAKDEQGKLVDGKIEIVETAHLEDRLNKNLQDNATIIIDLLQRKCIKRRFEAVQGPDEEPIILAHYLGKYKDKVTAAFQAYLQMTPLSSSQQQIVTQAIQQLESLDKPTDKS